MKKAFIITSALEVNNDHPLTYSAVRSFFSTEDRIRQTAFTLAALDIISDSDTTLFLVDTSPNAQVYADFFGYQENLKVVNVKDEFPEIYETVTTHRNKSHCETLIMNSFLNKYKDVLSEYDFFFKLSGRYFFDKQFDPNILTAENRNNIFFKPPLKFDWNDGWPYEMVDRRAIQGDNKLYQYCSVLYGWGRGYHDQMVDILRVIETFTGHPNGIHYDVETLLYYFTRQYENDIIETKWIVYGWDGVGGNFLRY